MEPMITTGTNRTQLLEGDYSCLFLTIQREQINQGVCPVFHPGKDKHKLHRTVWNEGG